MLLQSLTMNNAQIDIAGELDQLETIREIIRWATSEFQRQSLFFGQGATQAFDEAVSLIFPLLKLPYEIAEGYLDTRITQREQEELVKALQQRIIQRKPVAYITHEAWFAGLCFYVDERVLIPRSPIAELIAQGFQPWLAQTEPARILDLCTGSGCIAIACARQFPDAQVDAVDIADSALAVAAINVTRHQVEEQVTLVQSDLWAQVQGPYDLIVSNPPYVNTAELAQLPPEYHHEPVLGLAAGPDGLMVIRTILRDALDFLTDEGILVLEVGASAEALLAAYPTVDFIWVALENGGDGVFVLTRDQLKKHYAILTGLADG